MGHCNLENESRLVPYIVCKGLLQRGITSDKPTALSLFVPSSISSEPLLNRFHYMLLFT